MGVPQRAFMHTPYIDSIAEKLAEAHGQADGMRVQAREFALDYDADLVLDRHWKPTLAALEERRTKETAMPVATLNRKMRRAAERTKA